MIVITPSVLKDREGTVKTKYGEVEYDVRSEEQVYMRFDSLTINGVEYRGNVDLEKVDRNHYHDAIRHSDGKFFRARDYTRRTQYKPGGCDDNPTDVARKTVRDIAKAVLLAVHPLAFARGRVFQIEGQVRMRESKVESLEKELTQEQESLTAIKSELERSQAEANRLGLRFERSFKLPVAAASI
jgi:hypothetical protein